MNKELSDLLLKRRKIKGLTIAKLSKLSGVSQGLICKLELNQTQTQTPNIDKLCKIAQVLDINSNKLLNLIGFKDYEVKPLNLIDCLQQEEGLTTNNINDIINYINYVKFTNIVKEKI